MKGKTLAGEPSFILKCAFVCAVSDLHDSEKSILLRSVLSRCAQILKIVVRS